MSDEARPMETIEKRSGACSEPIFFFLPLSPAVAGGTEVGGSDSDIFAASGTEVEWEAALRHCPTSSSR
jgi:hypothetical protein